jgi:hypothetical protein
MNKREQYEALNDFLQWFSNHFAEKEWLDTDDDKDTPDGTWKSYCELPKYIEAEKALVAFSCETNHDEEKNS